MDLNSIMEQYGFTASSSGRGCKWYTKPISFEGKDAFIAITDDSGFGLPESLDDPVYVGIYDMNSGHEVVEARLHETLKGYLDSLQGD